MAEKVGFEPTVPVRGTHTFQACSLNIPRLTSNNSTEKLSNNSVFLKQEYCK